MTREEAIEWFRSSPFYHKDHEPLNMAIKALEQEPCEDCISRARVVEWLEKCTDDSIEHAINTNLEFIPPVIPKPKTGHWIRWYEQKEYDWGIDNIPHCKCSECGKEYDSHSSQFIKYCCECGVKMESEDKE